MRVLVQIPEIPGCTASNRALPLDVEPSTKIQRVKELIEDILSADVRLDPSLCIMEVIGAKKEIVDRDGGDEKKIYILDNGTQWQLRLGVKGDPPFQHGKKVQAKLSVDGAEVGTFCLVSGTAYEPLERPVSEAKKFTFYTVRVVLAAKAKLDRGEDVDVATRAVADSGITRNDEKNGTICCSFTPESCCPVATQSLEFDDEQLDDNRTLTDYKICDGDTIQMVVLVPCGATKQGASTLQGDSLQRFHTDSLGPLCSSSVTLRCRLYGTEEEQPCLRPDVPTPLRSVCPPAAEI